MLEVISAIAAAAGAAVAVIAWIGATVQARKANQSAQQSAAAATRSAEADERAAAAAERANELAERGLEHAERYVPIWTIEHVSGWRWMLVNGSAEAALGVMITVPGAITRDLERLPVDISPGGAFSFFAQRTSHTAQDALVTVTWHRPGDQPDQQQDPWTTPLPTPPRKPKLSGR